MKTNPEIKFHLSVSNKSEVKMYINKGAQIYPPLGSVATLLLISWFANKIKAR